MARVRLTLTNGTRQADAARHLRAEMLAEEAQLNRRLDGGASAASSVQYDQHVVALSRPGAGKRLPREFDARQGTDAWLAPGRACCVHARCVLRTPAPDRCRVVAGHGAVVDWCQFTPSRSADACVAATGFDSAILDVVWRTY